MDPSDQDDLLTGDIDETRHVIPCTRKRASKASRKVTRKSPKIYDTPDGLPEHVRAFTWTLNNYTPEEVDQLKALSVTPRIQYMIFGYEVGEEEGTPHLQGYTYYKNAQTLKSARNEHPTRLGYFKKSKADAVSNYDYCSKDGEYYEQGKRPLTSEEKGQGEIERRAAFIKLVEQGDIVTCIEQYNDLYLKHCRNLGIIQQARFRFSPLADLDGDLQNLWVYGPTRTGKSLAVRHWCKQHNLALYSKGEGKWFDLYNGEPVILIEECSPGEVAAVMKKLADRYVMSAESKGQVFKIRPKHVIVTSNYDIHEVFPLKQDYEAIESRFTKVHIVKPFVFGVNEIPELPAPRVEVVVV